MLQIFLSFLAAVLTNFAKAWFSQAAVVQSGVEKQQLKEQVQTNVETTQAVTARNNAPIYTDVSQLPKGPNPDFRD